LSQVFVITVDDNDKFLPVKDKVVGRRIRVAKMLAKGMTQIKISMKIRVSLSTIEKDIKFLRNNGKWVLNQSNQQIDFGN
jgi:transposase